MSNINQKGIGHHLMLIIAALVIVVAAAGYFVWNRQKDNSASAANTTIYSASLDGQPISIKACRLKGKLSVNVTYNRGSGMALNGAKALLAGLASDSAADVESTSWNKSGELTIKNYYVGQGGANGSTFDAFIIPVSGSLPNNGGAMQVSVAGLPSC